MPLFLRDVSWVTFSRRTYSSLQLIVHVYRLPGPFQRRQPVVLTLELFGRELMYAQAKGAASGVLVSPAGYYAESGALCYKGTFVGGVTYFCPYDIARRFAALSTVYQAGRGTVTAYEGARPRRREGGVLELSAKAHEDGRGRECGGAGVSVGVGVPAGAGVEAGVEAGLEASVEAVAEPMAGEIASSIARHAAGDTAGDTSAPLGAWDRPASWRKRGSSRLAGLWISSRGDSDDPASPGDRPGGGVRDSSAISTFSAFSASDAPRATGVRDSYDQPRDSVEPSGAYVSYSVSDGMLGLASHHGEKRLGRGGRRGDARRGGRPALGSFSGESFRQVAARGPSSVPELFLHLTNHSFILDFIMQVADLSTVNTRMIAAYSPTENPAVRALFARARYANLDAVYDPGSAKPRPGIGRPLFVPLQDGNIWFNGLEEADTASQRPGSRWGQGGWHEWDGWDARGEGAQGGLGGDLGDLGDLGELGDPGDSGRLGRQEGWSKGDKRASRGELDYIRLRNDLDTSPLLQNAGGIFGCCKGAGEGRGRRSRRFRRFKGFRSFLFPRLDRGYPNSDGVPGAKLTAISRRRRGTSVDPESCPAGQRTLSSQAGGQPPSDSDSIGELLEGAGSFSCRSVETRQSAATRPLKGARVRRKSRRLTQHFTTTDTASEDDWAMLPEALAELGSGSLSGGAQVLLPPDLFARFMESRQEGFWAEP